MKNQKRLFALLLSVVMIFLLTSAVSAVQSKTTYTQELISQFAKTQKIHAKLTSHSYDDKVDKLDMNFYDDLASDKICLIANDQGIKAVYSNGNVDCFLTKLFIPFGVSASAGKMPFLKEAFELVDTLQDTIKSFLNDPKLESFNKEISTVQRNGKTCTKERFVGKLLTVSGTFYYDKKGKLCELELTDTLGESIGFTVEDVSSSFNSSVFDPPSFFIDLSFLLKIFSVFF